MQTSTNNMRHFKTWLIVCIMLMPCIAVFAEVHLLVQRHK